MVTTTAAKDKGDGEVAVQARTAILGEPSRFILAQLHPMITELPGDRSGAGQVRERGEVDEPMVVSFADRLS